MAIGISVPPSVRKKIVRDPYRGREKGLRSSKAGVSKSSTLFFPSETAFTNLGSTLWKNPCCCCGGRSRPSLNSVSMLVNRGKPSFGSTMAVSSEGSNACTTDLTVFAEKVTPFTSENDSSLGT
ncbi:hypothetical protein Taro_026231 [Colocasia esculenta]|uniref:Uncharacterized protein n=1 Tax=Colocasia esculenta TaxID=4460 RepID=A0A843VK15_COLES|nr:hypothetical protein [Colocasia esculenta]